MWASLVQINIWFNVCWCVCTSVMPVRMEHCGFDPNVQSNRFRCASFFRIHCWRSVPLEICGLWPGENKRAKTTRNLLLVFERACGQWWWPLHPPITLSGLHPLVTNLSGAGQMRWDGWLVKTCGNVCDLKASATNYFVIRFINHTENIQFLFQNLNGESLRILQPVFSVPHTESWAYVSKRLTKSVLCNHRANVITVDSVFHNLTHVVCQIYCVTQC